MDATLSKQVRNRAKHRCEYCQMPQSLYRQRFPVDHIVARQHCGQTVVDNLALCCQSCNSSKGPNIAGIDPMTGQVTLLFHPRRDVWEEHFEWQGPELGGKTAVGRATIVVLAINHPDYVAVRRSLIAEGIFPPEV